MRMTRLSLFATVLFCLTWLSVGQFKVEAQWVAERQIDSYSTQAEQLHVIGQSLSILEKADPMVDLHSALKRSDTRFVGYRGAGWYMPGVPKKQMAYAMNHGVKLLKGSTDVLDGSLSYRLHIVAQAYMEPYNKALLRYMMNKDYKSRKKRRRK